MFRTLKIQLQSPPVPLLNNNATTKDFYGGDIATPFTNVIHSDLSLVMYYAPWDFDSQLAIHDFEKIANKYKGQVRHKLPIYIFRRYIFQVCDLLLY